MIDAVTYGMIPSANSEKCDSAEPEKRLSRPKAPAPLPLLKMFSIADWLTPGAGTIEPRR